MNTKDTIQLLSLGIHEIIPVQELAQKLDTKKKLVVKLGADPTSPDLHLGHAVVLSKLRQFQDLGHTVIFLIGDFTARIGDPTGRSKTRPPLTEEQIAHNTKTYFEQVSRILDPHKVVVRYNSEWLSKLSSVDWISLCSRVTIARLIERQDFAERLKNHTPISFHELMYPILQGYDSVALKSDVELGGTDQTFNLLMGRYLQEQFGQEPQVVLTVPLLIGLDGTNKMSKSLGNAIGLNDEPGDAFGKIMSISDDLMWHYYLLLLHKDKKDLDLNEHPMKLKKQLAHGIIARFWSLDDADKALKNFEEVFQKKDYSAVQTVELPGGSSQIIALVELLRTLGAVQSNSEARRLIESGAVSINEEKIIDIKATVTTQSGMLIRVGKHRFYKLA
jgi:tyrosyl-tRNA synthetase